MRFHKPRVVDENTGESLLSGCNMDNRQKHDREMEIGEPTLKTLKKLRQEQQKRAIMDICSFYRTATRYLTMHLPFANELLYDLAVLHPLMLKEDQVIHRTAEKVSRDNQTGLCRPTN